MPRKYKRRYRRKGRISAMALAKRNARLLSQRKPEVKFHDQTSTSTVSIAGGSTVIATCSIPQGTSGQERIGSDVTIKSMNIRGYFQKGSAATGATFVRMMVIQAMTDDSPTSATIFDAVPYTTSFRNMDHTTDFRVVYDRVYKLTQDSNVGQYFRLNFNKFPARRVQWDETDTTGANAQKGKIYVLFTSEEPTNPASYTITTRLRYIDC